MIRLARWRLCDRRASRRVFPSPTFRSRKGTKSCGDGQRVTNAIKGSVFLIGVPSDAAGLGLTGAAFVHRGIDDVTLAR
jgi:hypothetical protein